MVWTASTSCGRETDKIRFDAWLYLGGKGLDIGCGDCKVIPHAVGVDMMRYAGAPIGDLHEDGATIPSIAENSQDFVYSSHFLEHVVDYKAALARWWSVLKVGGFLVLYLPHREFYPNIGQPGSNPDHKHDFHPDDIKRAVLDIAGDGNCSVFEDEDRNAGNEYSFFLVFRKQTGGGRYDPWILRRAKLADDRVRTVCVARYGAIGDMALVSSVVASYKARGYHVVLNTSPLGAELMREDPNIDEMYKFETDGSFFIGTLEPFWQHLARRYDVFVNLTQSIEGTLLPGPENVPHSYPLAGRQALLNKNYMEYTHDAAGLPYEFDGLRFHPTDEGKEWAAGIKSRFVGNDGLLLGVCLGGSAIHKVYPGLHLLVVRTLIEHPNVRVILFGDKTDARTETTVALHAIELGIDPIRIIRTVQDKFTIRQSLAMAQVCDVLLGPETGIMQWNARELNDKIVLLSHSSPENLTKHWINVTPLVHPVPCGPCHQKHNDWKFCTKGHTGHAACMEFPLMQVLTAVKRALLRRTTHEITSINERLRVHNTHLNTNSTITD